MGRWVGGRWVGRRIRMNFARIMQRLHEKSFTLLQHTRGGPMEDFLFLTGRGLFLPLRPLHGHLQHGHEGRHLLILTHRFQLIVVSQLNHPDLSFLRFAIQQSFRGQRFHLFARHRGLELHYLGVKSRFTAAGEVVRSKCNRRISDASLRIFSHIFYNTSLYTSSYTE